MAMTESGEMLAETTGSMMPAALDVLMLLGIMGETRLVTTSLGSEVDGFSEGDVCGCALGCWRLIDFIIGGETILAEPYLPATSTVVACCCCCCCAIIEADTLPTAAAAAVVFLASFD